MRIALALLATLFLTSTRPPPPDKPNIIYIMVDDLGYGDLGCYGQKVIKTPHIDALAKEGQRWTHHYAGHTVCRPSRLTLWTGLHSGSTGLTTNMGYRFKPEDVTVAELLKEAGYATGGVGKWAMDGVGTPGHPNRNGFDFWFGYLDQAEAHNYYPEFLWRNSKKVPLPGNRVVSKRVSDKRATYSHDLMTDEALGFIRRNAKKTFLLHVHWTIPHANNEGGSATGDGSEVPDHGIYADHDWPSPEKGFAAMVTRMDRDVGRIVALLRELEIEKSTLVIFTSDNGPHHEGNHDHRFFDSNGPLRGYKRDLHDGGIRVPFIARWLGTIEAGSETARPSAFWDFLPTACELAGAKQFGGIDGISYLPTLFGREQEPRGPLYWAFAGMDAVRDGKWKAVRQIKKSKIELYDILADPGETKDISEDHPDVVMRLERILNRESKRR